MHWLDELTWDVISAGIHPVQHQVARRLKSFRLTPAPGGAGQARFLHRSVAGLGLSVIGYGREVALDAGQLGSFSILHRPLMGHYEVGGRRVGVGEAHLITPGEAVVMEWSVDCLLLVVRFAAPAATALGLETTWLCGPGGDGRLVLDLERGAGRGLGRTLDYVVAEACGDGLLARSRAAAQSAEALTLAALRAALEDVGCAPLPRAGPGGPVERAEAFMLARLQEPLDFARVACAAGVAPRTLSHAFRAHRNLGVAEWQQLRRLDRVHEELSRADGAPRSVTEVATRWGFGHLGRLSATYARRFGEPPSRTLRRARVATAIHSSGEQPCG